MQSNGRLDIRVNRRKANQRNSFMPSESEVSNEFANSNYSQTDQEISQNHSFVPKQQPNSYENKKIPQKELKESLNIVNNSKNNLRKNDNLVIIREENNQQNRNKAEKRKNNFNSLEPPQVNQQSKLDPIANNHSIHKQIQKPSPSKQEKKVEDINKNMHKLNESINDLRDNYNELAKKQSELTSKIQRKNDRQQLSPFGVKMSAQKQKEVQEFLRKKQQEERSRRKMISDYNQRQKHKIQLETREEEMLRERQRKKKLKELKALSKFQEKHIRWKEEQQQKKRKAEEYMKKYENQIKFHMRMQEEDKIRQKKREKKQRQILQERKDYFKSVDQIEIQEHQKWHDDKIYELTRERQDAKQEQAQRISQENANFNDLYRGQSHAYVQEQLQEKRKKKREPRDRNRRIRQYKNYVKKNHLPKTYQSKTIQARQLVNDSRHSHREVRRYKYYRGQAYGEVIESVPRPKNHSEQMKIGNNYLQFVKSLPKKQELETEEQLRLDPQDIQILKRKFNSIGKVKRQAQPIYDESHRKKTSIQIPKDVKRDQLKMIVLQLHAQDQKLKQKQILLNYAQHGKVEKVQGEQKQINQGLVDNIQRKLSLLAQI